MQVFRFDRGEKLVTAYGSSGLRVTRIAAGTCEVHLTCLSVAPGGVIGTHLATEAQLFLVVSGEGWVAGPDGEKVPVSAGWAARWEPGEVHTSGSETGFTAVAIEGGPLPLFEPEPPDAG